VLALLVLPVVASADPYIPFVTDFPKPTAKFVPFASDFPRPAGRGTARVRPLEPAARPLSGGGLDWSDVGVGIGLGVGAAALLAGGTIAARSRRLAH